MKKLASNTSRTIQTKLLIALLTSFVIGLAYFASTSLVNNSAFFSGAISEIADYERDIEDSIDDDPLFITSSLLNQSPYIDWHSLVSITITNPSPARVYSRSRPRSPPFYL